MNFHLKDDLRMEITVQ